MILFFAVAFDFFSKRFSNTDHSFLCVLCTGLFFVRRRVFPKSVLFPTEMSKAVKGVLECFLDVVSPYSYVGFEVTV